MMTANHDALPTKPLPPKSLHVGPVRADGKHRVAFVFPLTGRCIVKILSPDAIAVEAAKGYTVSGYTK